MSRSSACAQLYVIQALILNMLFVAFVALSSLWDPTGFARSIRNALGGELANEDVSRVEIELVRSAAPAAVVVAFVCMRAIGRSLERRREALFLASLMHFVNIIVLGLKFRDEARLYCRTKEARALITAPLPDVLCLNIMDLYAKAEKLHTNPKAAFVDLCVATAIFAFTALGAVNWSSVGSFLSTPDVSARPQVTEKATESTTTAEDKPAETRKRK
eukprot:TRINITY_DN125073_c0_g1_i1.p2 TRINITY_DN125073_c0_g1~~TRINITY_DN125073_c0_g1_i1.p2  ORF type:complete len:217 (-),score=41.11 TRINITY_DN125073_c0_g1_i1:63-713(-)